MKHKVLFLDTMVYLHYKPLDQIDWPSVVDADRVSIVVPPVTIRELQRRKDSGSNSGLRERAARSIRLVFKSVGLSGACVPVRKNVTIRVEDREPSIDYDSHGLAREVRDDQLIASMLTWKHEHPEESVVLATEDYGLLLSIKAGRQSIAAIRLPEELKLPTEPDPAQKEIRNLKRKVVELQSQRPEVSVAFAGREQRVSYVLCRPIELDAAERDRLVADTKARHPLKKDPRRRRRPTASGQRGDAVSQASRQLLEHLDGIARQMAIQQIEFGPTPEAVEKYNGQLADYYARVEEHYRDTVEHQNRRRRTVKLAMALVNTGSAPAKDVDIEFGFPGGLSVADTLAEPPKMPQPPREPKGRFDISADYGGLYELGLGMDFRPELEASVLNNDFEFLDDGRVRAHVDHVKHGIPVELEPLYVTFESHSDARSFGIEYTVLVGNLPDPITGRLDVIVSIDTNEGEDSRGAE